MSLHPPAGAVRITDHATHGSTEADGANGAFWCLSVEPGWKVAIIMSDGGGWDHVSVHAFRERAQRIQVRTPTWREMEDIRRRCWDPEDVVMQLHPAQSQYVNCHRHTLHLWRPLEAAIPVPPREFV